MGPAWAQNWHLAEARKSCTQSCKEKGSECDAVKQKMVGHRNKADMLAIAEAAGHPCPNGNAEQGGSTADPVFSPNAGCYWAPKSEPGSQCEKTYDLRLFCACAQAPLQLQ